MTWIPMELKSKFALSFPIISAIVLLVKETQLMKNIEENYFNPEEIKSLAVDSHAKINDAYRQKKMQIEVES